MVPTHCIRGWGRGSICDEPDLLSAWVQPILVALYQEDFTMEDIRRSAAATAGGKHMVRVTSAGQQFAPLWSARSDNSTAGQPPA